MALLQAANIGLRFLLELVGLAALGYWGFYTGNGSFVKWLLGIGTPLLAAFIWGTFGSPGAPYPLKGFLRLLLELFIIGAAAGALFLTKQSALAGLYTFIALTNLLLLHIWKQ
ncbi:MAG: YrdB family protein [Bacillota bacterium]|nr:YrdB family protein [Bacillota bacterium]MDP4171949.1 YrdB family protein [Bacillota bacterium]